MGRREEADSALRKDMFRSILDTFVTKTSGEANPNPEAQVLNLELLAYNFHESLDLGPLFKHVQRQLASAQPSVGPTAPDSLLWRLERVAEEVKERQLAAICRKRYAWSAASSTSTRWAQTRGRSARPRCA